MTRQATELSWRVGGPQGGGVDTAAGLFARACAMGGYHIFGRREYYSNIMGRHSYFDVRVAKNPLTSHADSLDLLATFEDETVARHALSVVSGGAIVYDTADQDTALSRMQFLDDPVRQNLTAYLDEHDLPHSNAGLLENARRRGVQTYGVPFSEISQNLQDDLGISQGVAGRMLNTVSVAVSCALLGYDAKFLHQALEMIFQGRSKIVDLNVAAVKKAYEYVEQQNVDDFGFRLAPIEISQRLLLVNGNQAVALGKLAAGMSFQTYYPISPATDESVYLEGHETFPTRRGEQASTLVIQTEDELSAVTMATGAAISGARSATATSGPGFSLMAEGLGYAAINEIPLVVTLYQRGGPSTGLPTRTEQGDLQFALKAGHGDFPRIVLASGDIGESFYDAADTFNYADRYQTVVVHLLDKALASTTITIPPFDTDMITIDRGDLFDPDNPEHARQVSGSTPRFRVTESGLSPRPLPGQPGGTYWMTGGEHTDIGRVTEDPTVREQQMEKRARKIELAAREIPAEKKFQVYGDNTAPMTILTWGSNKGSVLEAMERLEADKIGARLIQVKLLEPFPADELLALLDGVSQLVVVECNFSGQFARLLREQTGRQCDHLIIKYNGRSISGRELYQALKTIHEGEGAERIVLRNPYE